MQKQSKLSSDGTGSGGEKCERSHGDIFGWVWQILHMAGIWSQAVGFMLAPVADTTFHIQFNL
jgi:hypothetical protein